jgi:Leucine-rich repeat (LRR) protein
LCLFNGFKIESLNIRANKIKVLPEEISKLTNLTKIELNQLGLKALPESMAKMEKL